SSYSGPWRRGAPPPVGDLGRDVVCPSVRAPLLLRLGAAARPARLPWLASPSAAWPPPSAPSAPHGGPPPPAGPPPPPCRRGPAPPPPAAACRFLRCGLLRGLRHQGFNRLAQTLHCLLHIPIPHRLVP